MTISHEKSPENAGLHKHGMFAEEKHAIETLKSEMAYVFQVQDRRNQTRSLYFNQLWDKKDAVIASAMLAFFNASSGMRAIVETAVDGRDDAIKIQAVLIGLLAVSLVQNARVISQSHVSDRLIDRSKVVEGIIRGLVTEKFSHDLQVSEGLMPLAKYAQAACDKALNPLPQSAPTPAMSLS
ncbi:MAG: hypothetical protein SFW07_06390 [Gammaproteobacteria bacterium]|nr:hypothetical protein [Gammaproteobacteria bacterium]